MPTSSALAIAGDDDLQDGFLLYSSRSSEKGDEGHAGRQGGAVVVVEAAQAPG
jgi:hypothetical protein